MEILNNFIEWEKSIIESKVVFDSQFSILLKGFPKKVSQRSILDTDIYIQNQGIEFIWKMNNIFIHQIGKRIYGDRFANEYEPLFDQWVKDINDDYSGFYDKILKVFRNNDLVIRYYLSQKKNFIYGIVSSKYQKTDQNAFRDRFIKVANGTGYFNFTSPRQYSSSGEKGPVKEYFNFKTNSTKITINCGITYGLNNGYGAYSVHWQRIFRSSGAWLSPWKSSQDYKWRNNPLLHEDEANSEMLTFVEHIISQGLQLSKMMDELIIAAENDKMTEKYKVEIMNKLQIAYATKDRVFDEYAKRIFAKGNSMLTFIDSINTVGTNDNYTMKETKRLLIETGTRILEEGIESFLKDTRPIYLAAKYADWY